MLGVFQPNHWVTLSQLHKRGFSRANEAYITPLDLLTVRFENVTAFSAAAIVMNKW